MSYDLSRKPWLIDENDFPQNGNIQEKLRFLLRYAILAPSSHNTQPWQFTIDDNAIHIGVNKSRWLRVADADQRELYISTGCALENLLVAADHFGFSSYLNYLPTANDDLVATVGFSRAGMIPSGKNGDLFHAIPKRHTNHKAYDDRTISTDDLNLLMAIGIEPEILVYLLDDIDDKQAVRDLVVRGNRLLFAEPAYRRELGRWIGRGVFGDPWLMAKMGQLVVTYLDIGKRQSKQDSKLLMSSPVVGVLASQRDDRISQVKIGQVFERICLKAATLDLRVHPMSQVVEVPELKRELAHRLPNTDMVPQHAFRLGYAPAETEHTPRRTLETMLT